MLDNRVVIVGLKLEDYPTISEAITLDYDLQDLLHEKKVEAFGSDGTYWALGFVMDRYKEYVCEINIEKLQSYKTKANELLAILKQADSEIFADLTDKDIKLFSTMEYE